MKVLHTVVTVLLFTIQITFQINFKLGFRTVKYQYYSSVQKSLVNGFVGIFYGYNAICFAYSDMRIIHLCSHFSLLVFMCYAIQAFLIYKTINHLTWYDHHEVSDYYKIVVNHGSRPIGAVIFMQRNNLKMCLRSTDSVTDTSEVAKVSSGFIIHATIHFFFVRIALCVKQFHF